MLSTLLAIADNPTKSESHPPVKQFADYTLTRSIGRGGFGEVFLAVQDTSWKQVAIKMLAKRRRTDAAAVSRFELEIRVGKELKHPHVLPVIDDGDVDGLRYFATPFIEGKDLLHLLAKKPMPVPEAVRILRLVAEAVCVAHQHGYLHRDIKPANILIEATTGNPFVADFGLAKEVASSTPNTETLAVLGTQPYMPPEQADPHLGEFSAATDIYALGVTLYQCLTGRTPFPRSDKPNRDILLQIAWDPPLAPSAFNTQVPPDLDRLCLVCLQKSPFDRYESADELAADLRRFEEGKPIRATLPGIGKRFYRSCQRHPRMTAALAASLCLAATGGVVARLFATEASDSAQKLVGAAKDKLAAIGQRKFQEYVADMKEAPELWRNGKADALRTVLDRHAAIEPDMRGFEWYYWSRLLSHSSRVMAETFRARSLAISRDGHFLAGANERRAALFDVSTGRLLHRWDIGPGTTAVGQEPYVTPWIQTIAFSPDGKFVAAVSAVERQQRRVGHLKVWNTAQGSERVSVQGDPRLGGAAVAFSPDSRVVVAGGFTNQWYSWDVATNQHGPAFATATPLEREMAGMLGRGKDNQTSRYRVTDLRVSTGFITTAGVGGDLCKWTWPNGKGTSQGPLPLGPLGGFPVEEGKILLVCDDGRLALKSSREAPFGVKGASGGLTYREIAQSAKVTCFMLDGARVLTGDDDRIVRLWQIDENNLSAVCTGEYRGNIDPISSVAMAGQTVASADASGTIRVWPIDERFAEGVSFLAANAESGPRTRSPHGRYFSRATDGVLRIESPKGEAMVEIPIGKNQITNIVFSPDERFVAASLHAPLTRRNYRQTHGRARLVVWQLAPARQVVSMDLSERSFYAHLSFSGDGQLLAIASGDDGVRLLRTDSGSLSSLAIDRSSFFIRLSPNADYLAAGGTKGAGVWSLSKNTWIYVSAEQAQGAVFNTEHGAAPRALLLGRKVSLIDLATGQSTPSKLADLTRGNMAFSQDGRRLFAHEPDRLRIFATDNGDGTPLLDIRCGGSPKGGIENALDELRQGWDSQGPR